MRSIALGIWMTAAAIAAPGAWAQITPSGGGTSGNSPADCAQFDKITRQKTFDADDAQIRECILRGWDPPVKWRVNDGKNAGIRVDGSGGFSYGARSKPEEPPGKVGARASVGKEGFDFSIKFPPWDDSDDEDGVSCSIALDTSGLFGAQQAIPAGGSVPLTCGGSAPLSNYDMRLTPNPQGILITEPGSYKVWMYLKEGSGYREYIPEESEPTSLPQFECSMAGSLDHNVDIKPANFPVAQIVTYNGSSPYVLLRLQRDTPSQVLDPFDPQDAQSEPDMYVRVMIAGGRPRLPGGCLNKTTGVSTIEELTSPLTVQSMTTSSCEAPKEISDKICGEGGGGLGVSATCTTITTNPSGPGCEGKTQYTVLDRPNLMYPPGSSSQGYAIAGRTAVMLPASTNTRLYAQSETIVYFGAEGGPHILQEGGKLKLDNGMFLYMNGPATINAGGRSVTLTGGGSIQTVGGTLKQAFNTGSSLSPQAKLPYVVSLGGSIDMPGGYEIPSMPSPHVRVPVDAKPEGGS